MQPTRSLKAAAREEEIVKGRTGKQQDGADTDETTKVEEVRFCFTTVAESLM